MLDYIAALPEPAAIEAQFDAEAAYQRFVDEYRTHQRRCGDILWCPADWDIIPRGLWYQEFGYGKRAAGAGNVPGTLLQADPDQRGQGAPAGNTGSTRDLGDGIYPRGIMTGEDLCFQRGLLVSPEFLRREYFPLVEYAIEPLLAVGAKLVWHCDGDYRPIIDDVLACGSPGCKASRASAAWNWTGS